LSGLCRANLLCTVAHVVISSGPGGEQEFGQIVTSTADLLEHGRSDASITRALRAGQIHRVGHGLYSPSPVPDARVLANRFGVLSHTTAAMIHELDLVGATGLHVTARHHRRQMPPGVTLHRARLDLNDVMVMASLTVTTALRTLTDCARTLTTEPAVILLDSALRQGVATVDELRTAAARALGPGAGRLRAAADLVDAQSGSALETLTRLLFRAHALHPRTQAVIRDEHGFVARVDFLFDEAHLIVETDGYAYHSDASSFRADRRRQNALVRNGFTVVRFSWEDVRHRPDYVLSTVTRLLEATHQRRV
jgi:very-short-patch-repair endonuclease